MPLPATFRATVVLPRALGLPLAVILSTSAAVAQTPPATPTAAAPATAPALQEPAKPQEPAKLKVQKSERLDKHAAPWTVIWHTRLMTEVPDTQEFVKATHPDPKTLKYAPLVGTDPVRPKPRDAKGIAALQAELEGDLAHNAVRGKAINDIATPKAKKAATKAASKSVRARKTAKVAPASQAPKPD